MEQGSNRAGSPPGKRAPRLRQRTGPLQPGQSEAEQKAVTGVARIFPFACTFSTAPAVFLLHSVGKDT
jgi:hypothetical protein